MILNEQFEQFTTDHPESTATQQNLLPVPLIEPSDNSEAMIYLCGQSGRYITGITLPVDAGFHRQVGTSLAYRALARGVEMPAMGGRPTTPVEAASYGARAGTSVHCPTNSQPRSGRPDGDSSRHTLRS